MKLLAAAVLQCCLQASALAQATPGFQRILWLDGNQVQDAAVLQRVKAAGYTAVNLGRGADAKALQQAGLRCYLDQPFGKGLLELRDEDYKPLQQAYEATRDAGALLRPVCLQDEGALADAVVQLTQRLATVDPVLPCFLALADEASLTRHANPLDLCQCPRCLAAFRGFLQQRHADIAALNQAWGTDYQDFAAVVPFSTDQIRRRELGGEVLPANLQPWSEHLQFADQQFAAAVATLSRASQRQSPKLPVGLTGMQPPSAFGGHDFARLLPSLSLVEAYDLGGAPALAASLQPQAYTLSTLGAGAPGATASLPLLRLAAAAMHGESAVVVWNGDAVFAADGKASPFGLAVQRAFERLGPVLDACAGATLQPSDVWLLESQPSVRAWWMLDSVGDGKTWTRRLSSYEATHSTSLSTRASWVHILRDLGLQPRFVGEAELPERLLRERPRLLVLPACIALSDRCCQAIATYTFAGGRVVADFAPALYDDDLVLRTAGALDPLFGIAARSHRFDDLLVREGKPAAKARLQSGAYAAESGLVPDTESSADRSQTVVDRQGGFDVSFERTIGRGAAYYLACAVCDYDRVRLDQDKVLAAIDLRQRVRAVLQRALLQPPFEVRGQELPTCIERALLRTRDGRNVYACRLDLLDRPELVARIARKGSVPVTLQLPVEKHLRVLGGEDLGTAASFEVRLDASAGLFLVEEKP